MYHIFRHLNFTEIVLDKKSIYEEQSYILKVLLVSLEELCGMQYQCSHLFSVLLVGWLLEWQLRTL